MTKGSEKALLLTGFEPFAKHKENPSQLLVEKVSMLPAYKGRIDTFILPVSFSRAPELIIEQIEENGPYPVVLMLGLAAGRKSISLERVALNWIETDLPDEDQKKPGVGRIHEMGIEAYFSYAPLEKIKSELENNKIPVEISLNAGGYVCNSVYYSVLDFFAESDEHALFVHLPDLKDMPLSTQEKAVKIIIDNLLSIH